MTARPGPASVYALDAAGFVVSFFCWAGVRFSQFSGGLACVAGVIAVCLALPSFRRYRTDAVPSADLPPYAASDPEPLPDAAAETERLA